jgi:uncharacterized protein YaaR (DUF327 family)
MSSRITNNVRSSNLSGRKHVASVRPTDGPSFVEELGNASDRSERQLFEEMINDVDREARTFAENPSFENVDRYRAAVKMILTRAVSGSYKVRQARGAQAGDGASQKVFTIIDLVDEKLEELARVVTELDSTGLLARLGEIRGLLVDVYL